MIPKMVEIYKDKSLSGDSGSATFPLKRNDMILGMALNVRAKNSATGNSPDAVALQTVESCLSKIEVRSGSAVFKSYSGEMCRKIATYRDGILPSTLYAQANGGAWAGNKDEKLGWQEYSFPIDFTVKDDPMGNKTGIMFPAPLYDSLDLVLEYNFPTTAGAGFLTGDASHVFSLYAFVLPRPTGPTAIDVMKQKSILVETKKHDYTSIATGDKDFGLTLDANRRMRQLMVFAYEAGIGEGIDIEYLKLKVDGDTMFETKWGDLQDKNARDSNLNFRFDMNLTAIGATDELWTRVPAPRYNGLGNQATAALIATNVGDKITCTVNAADDISMLEVASDVLPACAVIDFDVDGMLKNLQPQGVSDLELLLTNGAAGATVTILEQSVARPWGHSA